MTNHLSRLEGEGRPKVILEINNNFPNEHILAAYHDLIPWFANFANFLASEIMPKSLNFHQRKKFLYEARKFY